MGAGSAAPAEPDRSPNFIIIYTDDLGYGDLACYGHPTIRTPHLDRMAAEGMRFTDFYSACSVCTPSRAALLTGRLPVRSGMCGDERRVLFPNSPGGLPDGEITLAEGLKAKGYATACIGKWHLGHLPDYLPTRHGFDSYYGIPYSNDMDRVAEPKGGSTKSLDPLVEDFNVPLIRDEEIVERPADQRTIARRYTEEAVRIIDENRDRPFFIYFAHAFPHIPLFASDDFLGKSPRGLYGDVVEEIDWSVGELLEALRTRGLAEKTLVVFTSDNGPWLIMGETGGSAGLLRDGKGSTWEGGMRVPCIAWMPGQIPAGVVQRGLSSTMDFFTTCLTLAGAVVPTDRTIDGMDIRPLLFGEGESPREEFQYYRGTHLYAYRKGPFKAHFITREAYGRGEAETHDPPILYHLGHDPSERANVADRYPEALQMILKAKEAHLASIEKAASQLDRRLEEE